MRRTVIAGNWKMNKNLKESISLVSELKSKISALDNKEVIICPPFTSLESVYTMIKDSEINLGAQNMSNHDSGAYTGEISADMLISVGCKYVILGHSERRQIFKENDELINQKLIKALNSGLTPIFCIGETLEEREKNITENIVESQILNGLKNLEEKEISSLIIAYEPVWAIGTGKTATPEQAQEIHQFIRNLIRNNYSAALADSIIIQYGGSVKPDNAAELLNQPDIDGALVGGACLNGDSFLKIINFV